MRRSAKSRKPRNLLEPERTGRLIGYARVSTNDQNLRMQIEALRDAGVPEDSIFTDKKSGRTLNRPGLHDALLDTRPGDQLIVWKMDRLSRSALDTLYLAKQMKEEGIHLRSLTESIDTTTPMGALVLQLMAMLAEFESAQNGFRTKRGMNAAARVGRRFGPEPRFGKQHFAEAIHMLKTGMSAEAVGKHFGVSGQVVRDKIRAHKGRAYWQEKPRRPKGILKD